MFIALRLDTFFELRRSDIFEWLNSCDNIPPLRGSRDGLFVFYKHIALRAEEGFPCLKIT